MLENSIPRPGAECSMPARGRPRKPGQRYPAGRLVAPRDRGTAELLARRSALGGDGSDPRTGYPLGRLLLSGRISSAEHNAGLAYAALHNRVWGPVAAGSNLGRVIAGEMARATAPANLSADDASAWRALIAAHHAMGAAACLVIDAAVLERDLPDAAVPRLRNALVVLVRLMAIEGKRRTAQWRS